MKSQAFILEVMLSLGVFLLLLLLIYFFFVDANENNILLSEDLQLYRVATQSYMQLFYMTAVPVNWTEYLDSAENIYSMGLLLPNGTISSFILETLDDLHSENIQLLNQILGLGHTYQFELIVYEKDIQNPHFIIGNISQNNRMFSQQGIFLQDNGSIIQIIYRVGT